MLYPLLSVPVRIVRLRVRNPVEAHGGPLPASLPRAYRTASTSWRQQCARTEAGMLGELAQRITSNGETDARRRQELNACHAGNR